MTTRVLVGVDDSPVSMRALRTALRAATLTGGVLRAVTVVRDGTLELALQAVSITPGGAERRRGASGSVLAHAATLAAQAAVPAETQLVEGEPGPTLVEEAHRWSADLIVVGRAERVGLGHAYVGEVTSHVLEFAEAPVLVVP